MTKSRAPAPQSMSPSERRQAIGFTAVWPTGAVLLDAQGVMTAPNERLAELLAVEAADLVGAALPDWFFGEDRPMLARVLQAIQRGESRGESFEGRLLRNDGALVQVEVTLVRLEELPAWAGGAGGLLVLVRDLSRRKQAEDNLKLVEDRLRLALEASGEGLWDLDVGGGWFYVSPRLNKMLGFPPYSLPASLEAFSQFLSPEEANRVVGAIHDAAHSPDGRVEIEFYAAKRDGGGVWILCRGRVVHWTSAGEAVRMAGTFVDITERKSAEEALKKSRELVESRVERRTRDLQLANEALKREIKAKDLAKEALNASEKRLRTIFDGVGDAIFIFDREGRVLDVNTAAFDMFAVSRDKALVGRLWDFLELDGPTNGRERLLDALAAPPDEAVEARGRKLAHGETFEAEVSFKCIDLAGAQAIMVVARDVSARREAERELKKLSMAVHQSPVSVVITDPAGAIEYVNPKFCEVSGYAQSEVLGRNPRVLKSGGQPKEFYADMWRTISSGGR